MLTIFKRELQAYFLTPVGYVFLFVFLSLSGVFFYIQNLANLSGDLLAFLSQITFLFMLLSPVLTMRLLCEERAKKTDQLLLSAPVSLLQIVLGKYLAAACVLLLAVLLTNVFVLILALYGGVYPGEWFVGYLGFTLQGLSFVALDLFVSGFMRNQVTAAVAAFGVNLALWMMDLISDAVTLPLLNRVFSFLSLYDRFEPFVLGQLSPASVVYYALFIAVCLLMTVRTMDLRRFQEGN